MIPAAFGYHAPASLPGSRRLSPPEKVWRLLKENGLSE
jgi:hypothetical protein